MVFWLKLVISLTQWVPTVRLKSPMIPLPQKFPFSMVSFPASGMRSAFPSVLIGMIVLCNVVRGMQEWSIQSQKTFELVRNKNYEMVEYYINVCCQMCMYVPTR